MAIIIIDNSATGDVESNIRLANIDYNNFHFQRELRQGIPFARNAALNTSKDLGASYVAFIDDDEIAPSNWLFHLISNLNLNQADVIVGEVGRCHSLEDAKSSASEYENFDESQPLPQIKTAVTSNVLFKSQLVQAPLNLEFDEKMVFGGSDREFFMRAILANKKIVSSKSSIVFETWPTERRQVTYLLMRWFRFGISFNYRYRKNLHPVKAHTCIWFMFCYKLIGAPIKLILAPIRKIWDRRPLKRLAGMSVANLAYAAGCIAPYVGIQLNKYY